MAKVGNPLGVVEGSDEVRPKRLDPKDMVLVAPRVLGSPVGRSYHLEGQLTPARMVDDAPTRSRPWIVQLPQEGAHAMGFGMPMGRDGLFVGQGLDLLTVGNELPQRFGLGA